MIRPQLRETFD